MNTRLQVEHPVTEEVTASTWSRCSSRWPRARALPDRSPPAPRRRARDRGPAVRRGPGARLPAAERRAHRVRRPGRATGIRVDAGFAAGQRGVHALRRDARQGDLPRGPTRQQAARRLAGALARARIHGVTTNRDLLVAILRDPDFLAGRVGTAFLDRTLGRRRRSEPATPHRHLLRRRAARAGRGPTGARRAVQRGIPVGWRNVTSPAAADRRSSRDLDGGVVRRPRRLRASTGVEVAAVAPEPR